MIFFPPVNTLTCQSCCFGKKCLIQILYSEGFSGSLIEFMYKARKTVVHWWVLTQRLGKLRLFFYSVIFRIQLAHDSFINPFECPSVSGWAPDFSMPHWIASTNWKMSCRRNLKMTDTPSVELGCWDKDERDSCLHPRCSTRLIIKTSRIAPVVHSTTGQRGLIPDLSEMCKKVLSLNETKKNLKFGLSFTTLK